MLKALPILAAAALAMAWTIPVCAIAGTPAAAASLEMTGAQLAENSTARSSGQNSGATTHQHHSYHRHYHHYRHYHRSSHHHYTYRHRRYRHHVRTASDDPRASEPKAEPTRGVIPKISP